MILERNELIIIWNIDDVRTIEPNMSLENCRLVLAHALETHDADRGINWQVFQQSVDVIKEYEVQE